MLDRSVRRDRWLSRLRLLANNNGIRMTYSCGYIELRDNTGAWLSVSSSMQETESILLLYQKPTAYRTHHD